MKNILVAITVLAVTAAAGLVYLNTNKEDLVRARLEDTLQQLTGYTVAVDDVVIEDWGKKILIGEISFYNPPGFHSQILAEASDITLEAEPLSFLVGKSHFHKITGLIDNIYIDRREDAASNLDQLASLSDGIIEKQTSDAERSSPGFYVGRLELQYDNVEFYQQLKGQPEPETAQLELAHQQEVYDGIIDPHVFIQAPAMKVINALGKGNLGVRRGKVLQRIQQTTNVRYQL